MSTLRWYPHSGQSAHDGTDSTAVERSAGSRAAIEQAKGAVMITYGLDEDEVFAMLRWHSQHTNIKLGDIAAGITDRTNDPNIAGLTADGKITEILAHLAANDSAALPRVSEAEREGHERLSA